MLHNGSTDPSAAPAAKHSSGVSQKRLVAFNHGRIGASVSFMNVHYPDGDNMTILRAEIFCEHMIAAAREWMKGLEGKAVHRLEALVDLRAVHPSLGGFRVICASI